MLAILPISTGYQIMGILHVLSVVVAFGPLFLYPSLHRAGQTVTIAKLHMYMALPALVLMWVFGMGLAGMSDDAIELSDPWVAVSIVLWAVAVAVSWFLIRPSLTDTSESARAKLSAGTGVTHLILVVGLYLMVFKPGA
jgi:uncharacterized membrane protein